LIWNIVAVFGQIHFYSDPGVRRCFYKELSRGLLLVGWYKLEIRDPDSDVFYPPRDKETTGVLIDLEETFASNHRLVHQKGSSNGKFTFSALDGGEHRICFTPRSFLTKKWYGNHPDSLALKDLYFQEGRITLDFVIGDSTLDSEHISPVTSLFEHVSRLNDKLIDIRREQLFIREKEANFRDLSERTCERVFRWLIVQLTVLFVAFMYQVVAILRLPGKEKEE
jgi:hypothetical protein